MKSAKAVPAALVVIASALYLSEHGYALVRYLTLDHYRRQMEAIQIDLQEIGFQAEIQADFWWTTEGEAVINDYIVDQGLHGEVAVKCRADAKVGVFHFAWDRMTDRLRKNEAQLIRRITPTKDKSHIDDAKLDYEARMSEYRAKLTIFGYSVPDLEEVFRP